MINPPTWSRDSEDFIIKVQNQIVRAALTEGYDVIVDNCHVASSSVKMLHKIAEDVGDVTVREKAFNATAKECLARNEKREGTARVPDKVITEMSHKARHGFSDAEAYYPPRGQAFTREQDKGLPKAIMCDLDGTLALIRNRNPYDASKCDEVDEPNWPVIECVKAMHAAGYKVIFMSGRESKYREQTERFIEKWVRIPAAWAFKQEPETRPDTLVVPHELHMRQTSDRRKDNIVKHELFDAHVAGKYYVEFVLDDRNQVVQCWRNEMGITCFQCAEGNF